MSREFHEWNPSLEQVEGKDTPQGHKIEVSSEAIEWHSSFWRERRH